MAWGKKQGIDDLLDKLRSKDSKVRSICILGSRVFGESQAKALAEVLAHNTTLEELLASGHNIGSAGAGAIGVALASNTTLQSLAIGGADFGDDAVQQLVAGLSQNSGLLRLDLEYKTLTQGSQLGSLLSSHLTLQELNLSRNQLDNDAVQHLSRGVASALALARLDLSENTFGQVGAGALGAALSGEQCRVVHIDVSRNQLRDEGGAALLQALCGGPALSRLLTLKASRCGLGRLSAEVAGQFLGAADHGNGSACALQALDLSHNTLGRAGLCSLSAGLPRNRRLTQLNLADTGMGDDAALVLAFSLRLRTAWHAPARQAAPEAAAVTPSPPTLALLDVGHNKLTGLGAGDLLQGGAALGELRTFNNPGIGDAGSEAIANVLGTPGILEGALRVLDLGATALTGPGIRCILNAVRRPGSLKVLEIGGNTVDAEAEAAILELSSSNPELEVVFRAGGSLAQSNWN